MSNEDRRQFGDRDWIVPVSIGGAAFGLLTLAMLMVGHRAMHISTLLMFIGVCTWGAIGFGLVVGIPIYIGISFGRYKFLRMLLSILLGIVYFAISGVLMANF